MVRLFCLLVFAIVTLIRCTTPSIVATNSIRMGDDASNRKNYEEAIKYYSKYLQVSPELGLYRNVLMEAQVYRKLGYVYSTQGKYQTAIDHLHRAIRIDSTSNEARLELVAAFRDLGVLNGFVGDYQNALKYLSRSLRMSEQMSSSRKEEKRASVADTYIAAAKIHLALGNFKEVEQFAGRGLDIYEGIPGEYEGIVEATLLLSIVKRDRNLLDDAREFASTSIKLARYHRQSTARQNQVFADIEFVTGNIEKAVRYQLQAVEDAERSGIRPQVSVAYMKLGDLYLAWGDRKRANEFYRKAMSIRNEMESPGASTVPSLDLRFGDVRQSFNRQEQMGSLVGAAFASLRIGGLFFEQENWDSAQFFFAKAKAYLKQAGQIEGVVSSNLELARVALRKGYYKQADTLLREVLLHTIQPEYKYQALHQIGVMHELAGTLDSSYIYYCRAIKVIDEMRSNLVIEEFKTLLANSKMTVYDRIIGLLMKHSVVGIPKNEAAIKALHYSEQSRSRAFLDMLGNQKIAAKSADDEVLLEAEQLAKLKIQQLTRELYSADDTPTLHTQLSNELAEARATYEDILHKLKLNNEAYATMINVEPPTPTAIQEILPKETVVVEYWLGDKTTCVWITKKDEIVGKVIDVTRKELSREVTFFRKSLSLREWQMTDESTRRLTSYLIRPIEAFLADVTNIIFIPHGDLHFVPFQALRLGSGAYVMEHFNVSSAPSAAVLHYCISRRSVEGSKVLAMALGGIEIGNFSGLPGTESELEKIRQVYPEADWASREKSSETLLKAKASDYNFLHIATHGSFNKLQPLYSFLLMTPGDLDDGHLTVREIFDLQLQCKLVTLSACETGLGEIEEADEFVGLSRAFIYAGAGAVVVSLWKVDDTTTAAIMSDFYQNLKEGRSTTEALATAQRNFLDLEVSRYGKLRPGEDIQQQEVMDKSHPYFWAPFVLLGDLGVK